MLCHLLDSVLAGHDVTLFIKGDSGRELLDAAAERLAMLRCRVLRAAGTPSEGLSLPLLLAQVTMGQGTWHPVPSAQNDEFLRRSFQALTVLDGTCDRIVLLVRDANGLQPAALRYVQLACRAGANLQLVLAGKRGFLDLLSPAEFADLRARLATGPIITPLPPMPAALPAAFAAPRRPQPMHDMLPPAPEPVEFEPGRPMLSSISNTSHRKRLAALAGIGLGVAGCVALAVWTHGGGGPAAMPSQQAALTVEMPMVPAAAVPAAPETRPSPASIPAPDASPQPSAASPEPAPPQELAAPQLPAAPQETKAAPQEATAPAAPLLAAPPPIPAASPPKNPTRKLIPAPPRALAARTPTLNAGNVSAWEDPYPPPSRDWRPLPPPQAMSEPPDQPKSYIGTYSTDANGVRAFRFGH